MKNFQQKSADRPGPRAVRAVRGATGTAKPAQRKTIEGVNLLLSQKIAAIQDYTNRIRLLDAQVAQMDGTHQRIERGHQDERPIDRDAKARIEPA